jgi:hypothetical protein
MLVGNISDVVGGLCTSPITRYRGEYLNSRLIILRVRLGCQVLAQANHGSLDQIIT